MDSFISFPQSQTAVPRVTHGECKLQHTLSLERNLRVYIAWSVLLNLIKICIQRKRTAKEQHQNQTKGLGNVSRESNDRVHF